MSNNSLVSLFDYIFYRIYKFFKEKGDNVPETKGSLLLSLMQCLTLLDIDVLVIRRFFNYTFFPSKYVMLLPLIAIGVINWYRYEQNFDISELDARWGIEGRGRMIRNGWFIGLYLPISFLIPVLSYYYLKKAI